MCDSLCLLSNNEKGRNVNYFAKNSDRDPNEVQLVEFHPRTKRQGKIKVTHIEVEFDGVTNAITISRPTWMWGAEMGINEYGVAIGNEAVFTSGKYEKSGLLGMDLLRLSLEKGKNAKESSDVIIEYLERYGQGGTNSLVRNEHYDNSFMISDWQESYVLHTVGKEWRRWKIENYDSISNIFLPSERMKQVDASSDFEIKHDQIYTRLGMGAARVEKTRRGLGGISDKPSPLLDLMNLMRSHSVDDYQPRAGDNTDICMHAGPLARRTQTVNSMVDEIGRDFIISWFTFSSDPCISIYKPIIFHKGIFVGSTDYGEAYWKSLESLHRKLNFTSKETYTSVMQNVKLTQEKVLQLIEPLRARLTQGENISDYEADRVYRAIDQLEQGVINNIRENTKNTTAKRTSVYDNWWERTSRKLKPVSETPE